MVRKASRGIEGSGLLMWPQSSSQFHAEGGTQPSAWDDMTEGHLPISQCMYDELSNVSRTFLLKKFFWDALKMKIDKSHCINWAVCNVTIMHIREERLLNEQNSKISHIDWVYEAQKLYYYLAPSRFYTAVIIFEAEEICHWRQ